LAFLLKSSVRNVKKRMKVSVNITLKNVAIFTLNIIPFAYFIIAVDILKWPPPGDIIGHALYVSLLRYNRRLTLSFEPLSPYRDYYPRGFHTFVANFAELTGLYSGEAVLAIGAFLSSLMPSLLFSLTYIMTDSLILSLVPYLASFHIHSTMHLEKWIFGYFYNGPYPCFAGMLSYVLLVSLIVIFRKYNSPKILGCVLLVLFQLLITYPNFFITAAPITLLLLGNSLWKIIKSSKWLFLVTLFLAITAIPMTLYMGAHYLTNYILQGSSLGYKINLIYFSDWSTWFMLLAIPMGIYLLFKTKNIDVSVIFLVIFLLNIMSMIMSTNDKAYRFLSLILPSRLIVVSWVLAWVLIPAFVSILLRYTEHHLSDRKYILYIVISDGCIRKLVRVHLALRYVKILILKLSVVVLAFVAFYPSLYQHFSLNLAIKYGWYSRLSSFSCDYNVSVWISQNVPPYELILNDMSYSGFYLPSYTFKRVVFHYFSHPPEYDEARLIWLYANNETLVNTVLKKLKIKWIFVTSEWGYLDFWAYGGSGGYKEKPFHPSMYIKIFDSYDFLKKRYQCGNSAVYEVLLGDHP
jgi:hypothetical protein